MNDDFKDIVQVFSWSVASFGGLFAAWRALVSMRLNREQRKEDLRWKRVQEAKRILDELFQDPLAKNAMQMLDWSGREYAISEGVKECISTIDMLHGLRIDNLQFNDKEGFIRDCFDAFFNKLDFIEHYISTQLIHFEDVCHPIRYYVDLMSKNKTVFHDFLSYYHYEKTLQLMDRYEVWKKKK